METEIFNFCIILYEYFALNLHRGLLREDVDTLVFFVIVSSFFHPCTLLFFKWKKCVEKKDAFIFRAGSVNVI
jgi:hypothetical protein